MNREELRRWATAKADAERREHEQRVPPAPEVSVRAALELLDVVAELHGWPPPEDPVERAEDERAWATWARLRNRLRHP